MRKTKRLLSVHPLDFDPEDYFPHPRRPSVQVTTPVVNGTMEQLKINIYSKKHVSVQNNNERCMKMISLNLEHSDFSILT